MTEFNVIFTCGGKRKYTYAKIIYKPVIYILIYFVYYDKK